MTNRTLKKLGVIALSLVLIFALAACSNDTTEDTPTEGTTVESVETVEYTAAVGTSSDDVIAELPATVEVTFSDDSTEDAEVAWTAPDNYDSATAGEYVFDGSVTLDNGDTDDTTATVTLEEDPGEVTAESASVETENPVAVTVEFSNKMFLEYYFYGIPSSVNASSIDDIGITVTVNGTEVEVTGLSNAPMDWEEALENDEELRELYFIAMETGDSEAEAEFLEYLLENYDGHTKKLLVWLNGKVEEGDNVSISYDSEETGAVLSDVFGNEVDSFDMDADNNVVQPSIENAVVENTSPGFIKVEYDTEIDDYHATGLTASINDTEGIVLNPDTEVNEKTYIYELNGGELVQSGDNVTISYDPEETTDQIDDDFDNELVETTNFVVTNDTFAPEFVDAYIGEEDTEATTSSTITVEANEEVGLGSVPAAVLADNGFTVRDDAGELVDLVDGGVTVSGKYVSVELAEAVTSSAIGYEVTYDAEAAADKIVDKSLEEVPGVTLGITNNLVEEEEVPLTLDTAEATTVSAIELAFEGELPSGYTDADLKDAITLTYNGTEVTNYNVTSTTTSASLSLNGDLDIDYATGDATIAIEDTDEDIDIPETDVADAIDPALVEDGITAVDNSTMTFEFTEPVSALNFKTEVDSTDLELTNSTITGNGTKTLTVALDSGFELPDGQFDDVTVGADAVEDAAGNGNVLETQAVVDEIAPEFTEIVVTVESDTSSTIDLTFSEDVTSVGGIGVDDFSIVAGGLNVTDYDVVWNDGESGQTINVNEEVTTDTSVTVEITSPEKVADDSENLLIEPFEQTDEEVTVE